MDEGPLISENDYYSSEESLLGIFLVKSGSKGDSLLFRYPYTIKDSANGIASKPSKKKSNNPFALVIPEDTNHTPSNDNASGSSLIGKPTSIPFCVELDAVAPPNALCSHSIPQQDENLLTVVSLPDRVVSNLFAVKAELCEKKFEIKINNVRFVGHPRLIHSKTSDVLQDPNTKKSKDLLAFNVVFALRAYATHDIVNCYHECSEKIAEALLFEEKERGYLSSEAKSMLASHDEAPSPCEDANQSPYHMILTKNKLAADLKKIYEDLKHFGTAHLKINHQTDLNLCIPQTAHRLTLKYHKSVPSIGRREVEQCVEALRPYHAILLLVEQNTLLDSSVKGRDKKESQFNKVIRAAQPNKNLYQISAESKVSLEKVTKIVARLIFWAKATIIYPLTEHNVYIINPLAPTSINSALVTKFANAFPKSNLLRFLSKFSLGTSISQLQSPLQSNEEQVELLNKVIWLLKHRLLSQIHEYVYFVPSSLRTNKNSQKQVTSGDDSHSEEIVGDTTFKRENDEDGRYYPESDFYSEGCEREILENNIIHLGNGINNEDRKLFYRCLRYFDGKHHLEAIMYFVDIRRSQLLTIIDKFRDVLFTCSYEDNAVLQLCPYHYK